MSKALVQSIALELLNASVKTQVREQISEEAVKNYTEVAKEAKSKGADSPFPDLVAFKDEAGKLWLSDGFHRKKALKAAGFTETKVEIHTGNEQDAFLYGLSQNSKHGVRLTTADYKHALEKVLSFPGNETLSNVELGKLIGKSEFFVRQNRPAAKDDKSKRQVNKGGKKITVDASGIGTGKGGGKKGKNAAKKAEKAANSEGAPQTPDQKSDASAKRDDALDRAITKIANQVSSVGFDALKFKNSIADGSLPVSSADLRKWSETSDARIKQIAPLVINLRWTVGKAIAFIDKVVDSETKIDHLVNLTVVAQGKPVVEVVNDVAGFKVVIVPGDFDTVRNLQDGSVTITPKAKK